MIAATNVDGQVKPICDRCKDQHACCRWVEGNRPAARIAGLIRLCPRCSKLLGNFLRGPWQPGASVGRREPDPEPSLADLVRVRRRSS
jgi:hypothetical protein